MFFETKNKKNGVQLSTRMYTKKKSVVVIAINNNITFCIFKSICINIIKMLSLYWTIGTHAQKHQVNTQ